MDIAIKEKIPAFAQKLLMQINFCCPEMQEALYGKFIVLERDEETFYCVINHVTFSDKSPKRAFWDSMRIAFCPFCGKKIEIEEK